ncbi:MAG: hypothetical protein AAF483_12405, partial [Planctomycetota bacterium]
AEGEPANRMVDAVLLIPFAITSLQGTGGLDRLPYLAVAAPWIAAAGWMGYPLVGRTFAVRWRGAEKSPKSIRLIVACLSVLTGLGLLSTLVLLLGLIGGPQSRILLMAAMAICVGFAEYFRRRMNRGETSASLEVMEQSAKSFEPDSIGALWMLRLLPILTCGLATAYLLGSLVPPWEFDVLEYHLQAPKEYFQNGKISFLEHNVYANMPLGVEMHSLGAMTLWGGELGWWHGGLIGKTITGFHALLVAGLIGGFVTIRFGSNLGWAAAGLILAMPGNAHVSFAGLVDTALGAYVAATLLVGYLLLGTRKHRPGFSASGLVVMGVLAGAATACKYPGLLFAVLPAGVLMYFGVRGGWPVKRAVLCCGLGLVVTCVPWFAKNFAQSGNPVFPLMQSVFGGRGLTADQVERWTQVHSPAAKAETAPYSFAALARDAKQVVVGSPFVNVSLQFLCAIAGFLVLIQIHRKAIEAKEFVWLASIAWIFIVWWVATHRIDRFWLPAVPMMAVLASVAASWLAEKISVSLVALILLVGVAAGGLEVVAGVGPSDVRFLVPLQAIEQQTLEESAEGTVNPTTAWVNRNLDAKDRVLSIGEVKAFLYRVPIVYGTCFNNAPGEEWLRDKSEQEQRANLADNGITHVMVDWFELNRYRSPGNYGFSDWPTKSEIQAMVDAGILQPLQHPFPLDRVEIFVVAGE